MTKKKTTKHAAAKKVTTPARSKARKKLLAKKDAILKANAEADSPKTNEPGGKSLPTLPATKSKTAAHNRTPHSLGTKTKVAQGGGKRLKGHVSATNKRSQSRRDSK